MTTRNYQHIPRWMSCGIIAALAAVISVFAIAPAYATSPPEFEVSGNTIIPGSNDWYQVQRESDYVSVCEGSEPCTVDDGVYVVINLTRGERFAGIRVPAPDSGGGGGENGVITFSEPGWYQVQNATTFETLCEGGTQCRVPPGTYIVINHTTGNREIETIRGSGGGGEIDFGDFSVAGGIITFTAPGWFQVQSSSDFETFCEGSAPCVLTAGTYIVINHTTGERWDNVVIEAGSGPVPQAVINSENYRAIVKQALEIYSGQAYDDRLVLFPYFRNSLSTGNSRGELVSDCFGTGSYRQLLIATPSNINTVEADFGDCRWFAFHPRAEDVVNGSFRDTFSPGGHNMNFVGFSVELAGFAPGSRMEVSGNHRTSCCGNGVTFDTENLDYFFTFPNGTLRVTDANTSLLRRFDRGLLRGGFTMQLGEENPVAIQVQTDMPFSWVAQSVANQGAERYLWKFTNGQMRLIAPVDGSSVTLNAGTNNPETISVTISNASESDTFIDSWGDWQESLYCTRGRCENFTVPGNDERQPSFF